MNPPSPVYATPVLGRFGLTHGLLAWARCRLWCEDFGATMVAPQWFKLRIGPYLRRERDKRNYFLLFQPGTAISGMRRLRLLTGCDHRDVKSEWPQMPAQEGRPLLLKFHNALHQNEVKSFAQVRGRGHFLRQELTAITRPRYRPQPVTRPFVAIHVRLGDFTRNQSKAALSTGAANSALPPSWFADRLRALRDTLGADVPAVVFSDGQDSELRDLLNLPGVERSPRQASITDLLQMGQSACVISSGSGFSLWGAFLGDAPRLCFPGQMIVPALSRPEFEIESDVGMPIPAGFAAAIKAQFT